MDTVDGVGCGGSKSESESESPGNSSTPQLCLHIRKTHIRIHFPRFLQIRLGSESCDQISASPNRPKRAKSRDNTPGSLFTRAYTLVKFSQTKRCFFSFL